MVSEFYLLNFPTIHIRMRPFPSLEVMTIK